MIDIVKEKNIILRIIQGTRSHDLNQLQAFKAYENSNELNFRIIESVSTEDLLGMHLLYIPEEYPEDAEEFYKEYKNDKYHIGFAHGTFDFVAPPGSIEISNRSTHSSPVLIWKEWKDAFEKGFISSGHIHGRNVYSNKIYYPGSFSRWSFGERSDKGFTYFEYDLDNETYTVKFIDNTLAPKYEVTSIRDLDIKDENQSVESFQKVLDEMVEKSDNLKIDLAGLPEEKIKVLKEYYRNNPKVKIEVKDSKKELLRESKEATSKDFEKWHYITKRALPLNETIKKFCKEELGTDISIDMIDSVIGKE